MNKTIVAFVVFVLSSYALAYEDLDKKVFDINGKSIEFTRINDKWVSIEECVQIFDKTPIVYKISEKQCKGTVKNEIDTAIRRKDNQAREEARFNADAKEREEKRILEEKIRDEQIALQQAKEKEYANCINSVEYQLYSSSIGVIGLLERQSEIKQSIKRYNEITRASKIRNLADERQLQTDLYDTNNAIPIAFAEYKKLGGAAKKPSDVPPMNDPCEAKKF